MENPPFSPMEWMIIGVVAVLLFGSRLPVLGRLLMKLMGVHGTCPYCGKQSFYLSHCLHCGRPRHPRHDM